MSTVAFHGLAGTMLIMATAPGAAAQVPHTQPRTSAVQQLGLDSSRTTNVTGRLRELKCRGKPGIEMRVHQDPSPRQPDLVTMVLRYEKLKVTYPLRQVGMGSVEDGRSVHFQPGGCTWAASGDGFQTEPGIVYFDLPRDAQAHAVARDTTIEGAVYFPDVASLPRYMSDSSRFWVFYVDDVSNVSISFGRWPLGGAPAPTSRPVPAPAPTGGFGGTLRSGAPGAETTSRATTSHAVTVFRAAELRCRGGPGLAFDGGRSIGDNQVLMTLVYTVSPAVPGETGRGLAPGSCAWVDRAGLTREPGRMAFVTAGNAQLRQAQSGSAVDRSPTAAERWPDAHTIPAYMSDPGRYWRFSTVMVDADSARQHGPWKPPAAAALAGPVSEASPTLSIPGATTAGGARTVDSSRTSVGFDATAIRGIVVTPGVASVQMRFAGPAVMPLVQVSTSPPFREPSSGRWIFPPGHVALSVARDAAGGANAYSAASTTPLGRVTEYHYIINAPKPASTGGTLNLRRRGAPDHRQAVGTFRTLRTNVTVRIGTLRIIDDSDGGGNGDLAFTFTVNGREKFEAGTGLAQVSPGSPLDLADGATLDFAYDIFDYDVPGLLRIHAAGFDDDNSASSGSFDASWNATPGGDSDGDWNHARAEFNLDRYPERSFDFPFRMRTGPGSRLQFEVEGRVSVTRE